MDSLAWCTEKKEIKSAKLRYLVLYDNISLEFLVPQIKFGEISWLQNCNIDSKSGAIIRQIGSFLGTMELFYSYCIRKCLTLIMQLLP